MRTELALAAALLLAAPRAAALAQDAPEPSPTDARTPEPESAHGRKSRTINLSDLPAEQRALALDAWKHVYCACPDEKWSRTLANCPDGCADRQKQEILARILQGWKVPAIVEEQVEKYGERANADPGASGNGSLLVIAGLLIGAGAAGAVLASWQRAASARRTVAGAERAAAPVGGAEADAVERELREIE